MKCEISQQLYVDFLNMLTYTQQVARTPIPPNSAEGTYFYNQYRHKIKISSPGIENTIPAVYISDYPFVACANLSWGDITAHLDWCGLRPMTELEYEKSCRGPLTSVKFEFAYGTNSPNNVTGITNIGTSSEISQYSGQNLVGMRNIDYGPMRVGSLARDNYFNRESCGATYYGILDMSGNVSEFTITVGRSICRAFTGLHGNGMLNTNGDADVLNWPPGTSGMGWRGGAWNESPYYNQNQAMNISYRDVVNNPYNGRTSTAGGRGVRTEP
jgi:formylglycine-generating enzyme required for sulfatase activity